MTFRLGVDIGGTFTDFALFDERGNEIAVAKRLTTPADPSIAVIEGAAALLRREDVSMAEVESIAHGTTLVTNAVIERRGAKTGMLVTAGFRDILDMGFEQRYDLFDLRLTWSDPLVPRRLRREVPERVGHDGQVLAALDLERTRAAVRDLVETAGIEALAICFLHSYANPAHEDAAGELVGSEFPHLHVSRSAEVFGNMREYERWTTATMNAYTQPMFDRYVERLERGLADLGFGGRLFVMTSSGASIVPETARRFPVRALESGPAAGALMSAHHGRTLGFPDLLSFDMGGTTAKGALVRGFTALKQYDLEVGRDHEFKAGSGLPVKLPVIDMIEIGSGGGSLARVDERGLIRVGPRSAGADPGPACYARGGTGATLTDADVVLGYLDPEFFLGGEMRLDAGRGARRHRGARRAAGRTRPDPRRLGRARDRERGRGAGVPHPRLGARVRLPAIVDGRVRRLGPRARARDRPQAPHPPRHLSHRGRRDVGARVAGEPARLRGLALAPGVRRRPRRRVVRGIHRTARRGGFGVPPPGRRRGPAHRHPARHALPGPGLRDRGDPARRRNRHRLRRAPSRASTSCFAPGTPRSSRRRSSTNPWRS